MAKGAASKLFDDLEVFKVNSLVKCLLNGDSSSSSLLGLPVLLNKLVKVNITFLLLDAEDPFKFGTDGVLFLSFIADGPFLAESQHILDGWVFVVVDW